MSVKMKLGESTPAKSEKLGDKDKKEKETKDAKDTKEKDSKDSKETKKDTKEKEKDKEKDKNKEKDKDKEKQKDKDKQKPKVDKQKEAPSNDSNPKQPPATPSKSNPAPLNLSSIPENAPESAPKSLITPRKNKPPVTETKPNTASSTFVSSKFKKKKKKKKAAEPTKWSEVKESEEMGEYLDEPDDDDDIDQANDDEDDNEDNDLRQYLQDMEDPLGIGGEADGHKRKDSNIDDDSDDETESIISPRKARRIAAKKSKGALDPTSEKFDAVMYLVKLHQNTPIEDLLVGKNRLEQKVTSRQRQLEFLVKDNFARFMICKDAVDEIYLTINGQKMNNSAKIVDQAAVAFNDLLQRSQNVFVPLLNRQGEIDRIKSVLGILKRSQFIFNLPRRMRDNIAAGEYSKVVLNYKKVKSLVATASHASIKNVVSEVDSIVKDLRQTLFETLDQPNVLLKQQEDTIKLLVDLGSPVDPAWYCMELRHNRTKQLLLEKAQKANPTSENAHYSLGLAQPGKAPALIIQATSVLQEHLPPFLHLARGFFARSYHKSLSEKKKLALGERHTEADFIVKLKEIFSIYSDIAIKSFYGSNYSSAAEVAALEVRPGRVSTYFGSEPTKHKAVSAAHGVLISIGKKKKKTKKTIGTDSSSNDGKSGGKKILASSQSSDGLVTASNSNAASTTSNSAPELSINILNTNNDEPEHDKDKVMVMLKLYTLLSTLTPVSYLEPLAELLDLTTRTYVREIFAELVNEAKVWYSQEDWVVLDQQKMITSLPFTFESAMQSTLDQLQGLIQKEDPLIVYVQKKFTECLETFADNIHHLAFVEPFQFKETEEQLAVGQEDFKQASPTEMSPHARLLVILNNCTYTKKYILPDLQAKFKAQYGRELYSTANSKGGIRLLEQLEDMILRKYVCQKTIALNDVIRNGLLFSGFDWSGIRVPPNGVRDYVMTVMLELVFIHDELYRVSRLLVRPVLSTILENIHQSLIDCLQYIDAISNHGVLQIGMELEFIGTIMRKYKSDICAILANELDASLQYNAIMDPKSNDVPAKDKKVVKGLINSKLEDAALLIECFTGVDVEDLFSTSKAR